MKGKQIPAKKAAPAKKTAEVQRPAGRPKTPDAFDAAEGPSDIKVGSLVTPISKHDPCDGIRGTVTAISETGRHVDIEWQWPRDGTMSTAKRNIDTVRRCDL